MSPTAARAWAIVVSCVLLLPLTACSKKTGAGSSPELAQARMATNPALQSAFLAYEHEVRIEIRADEMALRLQALHLSPASTNAGEFFPDSSAGIAASARRSKLASFPSDIAAA